MAKDRKAGKATQDGSGGFAPNNCGSVKSGKQSGSTQTASVSSPSKLRTGTSEGTGGSQKPAPAGTKGPTSGGYQIPYGRK